MDAAAVIVVVVLIAMVVVVIIQKGKNAQNESSPVHRATSYIPLVVRHSPLPPVG